MKYSCKYKYDNELCRIYIIRYISIRRLYDTTFQRKPRVIDIYLRRKCHIINSQLRFSRRDNRGIMRLNYPRDYSRYVLNVLCDRPRTMPATVSGNGRISNFVLRQRISSSFHSRTVLCPFFPKSVFVAQRMRSDFRQMKHWAYSI
jgi:hypothetical protein